MHDAPAADAVGVEVGLEHLGREVAGVAGPSWIPATGRTASSTASQISISRRIAASQKLMST